MKAITLLCSTLNCRKTTPINRNNTNSLKCPQCAVMYLLLTHILNLNCSTNTVECICGALSSFSHLTFLTVKNWLQHCSFNSNSHKVCLNFQETILDTKPFLKNQTHDWIIKHCKIEWLAFVLQAILYCYCWVIGTRQSSHFRLFILDYEKYYTISVNKVRALSLKITYCKRNFLELISLFDYYKLLNFHSLSRGKISIFYDFWRRVRLLYHWWVWISKQWQKHYLFSGWIIKTSKHLHKFWDPSNYFSMV